jgi:hypothetical protein
MNGLFATGLVATGLIEVAGAPPATGTVIIKLAGPGGLAGKGGLAGRHGGLAG